MPFTRSPSRLEASGWSDVRMKPYSSDSLAARRRRRRRADLRRRIVSVAVLVIILTLGVVAITSGKGGTPGGDAAPVTVFVKRSRAFPRAESNAARLPYVAVAGKRKREVALTFDDGPGPYTAEVVRTLKRMHAPATLFQVGGTEHYFIAAEQVI